MSDSRVIGGDRVTPWSEVGQKVKEGSNTKIETLLKQKGLDWEVEAQPLYLANGIQVPGKVANVRKGTNTVLGVVSDQYTIVQNGPAFSFIDGLKKEGMVIDTVGEIRGKKIWVAGKFPQISVNKDPIDMYALFINSHDGKGAVKVAVTPTRAFCQNVLTQAIKNAERVWAIRHTGELEGRLHTIQSVLQRVSEYGTEFLKVTEGLWGTKINNEKLDDILELLFPIKEDMSDRKVLNVEADREQFMAIYKNSPDLKAGRGTAWGVLNAASAYATHRQPKRATETYKARLLDKVVDGVPMIQKAYDLILKIA